MLLQLSVSPFLQGVGLLVFSPMIVGILRYLKALFSSKRRHLVTIFHPYWYLWETAKLPSVRARVTSLIFICTPIILMASYGALIFSLPLIFSNTILEINLVMIAIILGLARFSISLAGMDTMTSFGWLGGSREMYYQLITEVSIALFLAGLAIRSNTFELVTLMNEHVKLGQGLIFQPTLLLLSISFWIILLFELGRNPVGNPATHLELTMGHKAILLEYAGRDLVLVEYSEMVKFGFLATLFVNLFFPSDYSLLPSSSSWVHILIAIFLYLLKIVIFLLVLTFWEGTRPRRRLREIIQLGFSGMIISILAILYGFTGL